MMKAKYTWLAGKYIDFARKALEVAIQSGNWAVVTYDYDELGKLSEKTYGSGVNAVTETLEYNIQGWLTGQSNPRFSMKLRYFDAVKAPAASYTGNIVEWEWKHGTSTPDMYAFSYDALSRLTDAGHYRLSGTSWSVANNKFTEQGISYDRHGNIKTLQRVAAGVLTDNLAYSYTGNQLTSLTESARSTSTADIYAPGSVPTGSYAYDDNGNMVPDSRRGLTLGYNYLNLLREVKADSTVQARYTWLTDGSKLRVRDAGSNGFDYLGSLIYKSNSAGLQLETASFGEGVIRASVSNSGGIEVNYFLTDHLGSVRVIVDGNGVVKERNDYYPFGARHVRSDYPQLAANRFRYTGKEEQVTGDLEYLDYGARMYDSGLGRWFGMDLMAEDYISWSGYNYTLCNPVKHIDPNGMWVDSWLVNSNGYIEHFENNFEDRLYFMNKDLELVRYMRVKDRTILDQLVKYTTITGKKDPAYGRDLSFAIGDVSQRNEMFRTFFFLANNTDVEWRIDHYLNSSGASQYSLGTLHDTGFSPAAEHMGHSTESTVGFVHSHPNVKPAVFWKEFDSMGWDMNKGMAWEDTDVGYKMFEDRLNNTMSYVYFPVSRRLWHIEKYSQPSFIKKISTYKGFLFGRLNAK